MDTRILVAAALCAAACGGTPPADKTGALDVELTQAPPDVSCLQLTVTGATRSVTRSFDLASGQSTASLSLTGLPTGSVLLSANAWSQPCASVTGAAGWIAVAQKVTVPGSASIVLQRNGQATVSVNFQDDQRKVTTLVDTAANISALGIAADNLGNLYVTGNSAIRKVVISTGAISVLAGAPGVTGAIDATGAAARFSQPEAIACDTGCANLYVVDSNNCTIRKVVVATAAVTTVAGAAGNCTAADGTPGAFSSYTGGLSFDPAGNLWVADSGSVRKVVLPTGSAVAGTTSTPVGSLTVSGGPVDGIGAAARFGFTVGGTFFDGLGNLFVADFGNGAVRKVVLSTLAVTTIAGSIGTPQDGIGTQAHFTSLWGMTGDNQGNLFVTDYGNYTVRKVVLANAAVVTIAGSGSIGTADGLGAAASFNSPFFMTIDSAGVLWVPESGNGRIRSIAMP